MSDDQDGPRLLLITLWVDGNRAGEVMAALRRFASPAALAPSIIQSKPAVPLAKDAGSP